MTRKHYIALAAALARTRPEEWNSTDPSSPFMDGLSAEWRVTRDAIASVLQADNPNFDRARFYAATEK